MDNDNGTGEIQVLNSDIDEIGRRQSGAVEFNLLGSHAAKERGAMESDRWKHHDDTRD